MSDDYKIHLNQSDTFIDGYIKCGCKSTIKLPFRLHAKSFQLSQYFKHLKRTRCAMLKKKRQELKESNNLSYNTNQTNVLFYTEEAIDFDEEKYR